MSMYLCLQQKVKVDKGWQDGLAGKGGCYQTRGPAFVFRDPHDELEELTLIRCLFAPVCTMAHMYASSVINK